MLNHTFFHILFDFLVYVERSVLLVIHYFFLGIVIYYYVLTKMFLSLTQTDSLVLLLPLIGSSTTRYHVSCLCVLVD